MRDGVIEFIRAIHPNRMDRMSSASHTRGIERYSAAELDPACIHHTVSKRVSRWLQASDVPFRPLGRPHFFDALDPPNQNAAKTEVERGRRMHRTPGDVKMIAVFV